MAQKSALLSSSFGQLKPLIDELKVQNKKKSSAEPKLKRTPSPQERVKTNDTSTTMMAKIYILTKKQIDDNKAYKKEQVSLAKLLNKNLINVIEKTSENLKKAIEKSIKIDKEALEENIESKETTKLFEEEKQKETESIEQRRHKELLEALGELSGKRYKKGKEEDKGGIFGALALFAKGIAKLLLKIPGVEALLTVFKYMAKYILPLAKEIIMLLVRNPAILAILGAAAAAYKMGEKTDELKREKEKQISDELQKIDAESKTLAEKGDVEGLKKLQQQRDELKSKQAVIDVMEGRRPEDSRSTKIAQENKTYVEDKLYSAAKAGSKPAQAQLDKIDEETIKKQIGTKETYSSAVYSPEGTLMYDTGVSYENARKEAKGKIIKEREERQTKIQEQQNSSMTFAEVVNKNFATIKKREGFRTKTYASAEGGTDTVGIGHKLTDAEAKAGGVFIKGQLVKVDRNTPLTEQQVLDLYYQDINKHMMAARERIGKEAFDKLPGNKQYALAELSFAGGPGLISDALIKAIRQGDMGKAEQIIRQTGRYYTKDGQRVESPHHAKHADIRAEMFAKGPTGTSEGTAGATLASADMAIGKEGDLSPEAPEKKPGIFSMLASGLKDQLNMMEEFKTGGGANELADVLNSIAPSTTTKTSALAPAMKEMAALKEDKNPINIVSDNRTTVVNKGSDGAVQIAKAEVRNNLPIMEKVVYNYLT